MKLYGRDQGKIASLIKQGKLQAILLHGPNIGQIQQIISYLAEQLNYTIYTTCQKELSPSTLSLLCNRQNMFGQPEMIKCPIDKNTINKDIKGFFQQSDSFINLPVFIGSETMTPAGYRKFFESQANLASIGCYFEEASTVAAKLRQSFGARRKQISGEDINYLAGKLSGNSLDLQNELTKLLAYCHDKTEITTADIDAIITTNSEASGDMLCYYHASAKWQQFFNEIEKLKLEGINEILIIRALSRYYLNLLLVKRLITSGSNIDLAIKKCTPPIFFKYVASFRQIANNISYGKIITSLELCHTAELSVKASDDNFNFIQLTNI